MLWYLIFVSVLSIIAIYYYISSRLKNKGYHGCHEYVDLGLPSGTLWATCNVGATKPEGYGDYFAWGETEPKYVYDWKTYKWCKGSLFAMTKYCSTLSPSSIVDNRTIIELSDDVANANLGCNWRMPTKAQQDELCKECTWIWTILNGVYGYRIISKINANYIFLPASGICMASKLYGVGLDGYYWSSSLSFEDCHKNDNIKVLDFDSFLYYGYRDANFMTFSYDCVGRVSCGDRMFGLPVRPVMSRKSGKSYRIK